MLELQTEVQPPSWRFPEEGKGSIIVRALRKVEGMDIKEGDRLLEIISAMDSFASEDHRHWLEFLASKEPKPVVEKPVPLIFNGRPSDERLGLNDSTSLTGRINAITQPFVVSVQESLKKELEEGRIESPKVSFWDRILPNKAPDSSRSINWTFNGDLVKENAQLSFRWVKGLPEAYHLGLTYRSDKPFAFVSYRIRNGILESIEYSRKNARASHFIDLVQPKAPVVDFINLYCASFSRHSSLVKSPRNRSRDDWVEDDTNGRLMIDLAQPRISVEVEKLVSGNREYRIESQFDYYGNNLDDVFHGTRSTDSVWQALNHRSSQIGEFPVRKFVDLVEGFLDLVPRGISASKRHASHPLEILPYKKIF